MLIVSSPTPPPQSWGPKIGQKEQKTTISRPKRAQIYEIWVQQPPSLILSPPPFKPDLYTPVPNPAELT